MGIREDTIDNCGGHTHGKWGPRGMYRKMFIKQDGKCCYCDHELDYQKTTDDFHRRTDRACPTRECLKRREDGGVHERDNIALSCQPCNGSREDTPWPVWKSFRMREPMPQWAIDMLPKKLRKSATLEDPNHD